MTWLFSKAMMEEYGSLHCSPERVAEYSAASCSDGEQSAPLNVMLTPQQFWRNDKMMDCSTPSLFGLTLQHLTADRGAELLTSFLAAFPVRTLVVPEQVTDSTGNDQACGVKCSESFAQLSPDLSKWKTAQCSLFEDLELSLETWPKWGLMRDGECWELISPVTTISEIESGLLPTVLATDWKGGTTSERKDNGKLRFDQWRDYIKLKHGMTYPHPMHSELRMGWPIGWTDLKPLETAKFQEWLQAHLNCLGGAHDNPA